ncbi:MAG: hypothetical protein SGARI_000898, partial [Bacillariaceae sp.]
ERRQREAEAQRQQAELERKRKLEDEKRQQAEAERLRLKAEARQKAEEERRRQQEVEARRKAQEERIQREARERAENEERMRQEAQAKAMAEAKRKAAEATRDAGAASAATAPTVSRQSNGDYTQSQPSPQYNDSIRLMESEFKCQELQTRLEIAEQEIEALRNQANRDKEKADTEKADLISQFQDKESRLLKATSEENQNQTLHLEQEYKARIQSLEQTLAKERMEHKDEQAEYKSLLVETNAKLDRAESQMQATSVRFDNETNQLQQREERAKRKADDRVAQTMAVLDERNEEITHLKSLIRDMESKVNEHEEGVEEAEEELEELQHENDSLRAMLEKLQKEKKELTTKIDDLEHDSESLAALQMEMTMVKEDLTRERTKNQSVVDSAITSHSQVESERDSALSELRDLKQQLAAVNADLEVARADNTRIMTANNNLQSALEAFQDERQAEMSMIDEQRLESEEALKSAHEASLSALRQTHDAQIYDVQKAAAKTMETMKGEMELLEGQIEKLKSENNQMRRSLDEAIHRLQSTQEDVIDRNVMKQILLDWCMLKDKTKRHQVLQVMANLLHFSEEEKEKVHLTSMDLDSVRARFVGALAAPLPPSKADVEHLEGDNVREKFLNFLMAETEDE